MNKALFFISYHPGMLNEYSRIREKTAGAFLAVLIMVKHPYVTREIIDMYEKQFDRVIVLPDVHYIPAVVRGLGRARSFLAELREKTASLLSAIDSFTLISDCSAYLPVNLLVSTLKKSGKCRELISVRQDYHFNFRPDLPRSLVCLFYAAVLRIRLVWCHALASYLYVREPRDRMIRVVSGFRRQTGQLSACDKTYYLCRDLLPRAQGKRDIVVIYSDRQLDCIGCDISADTTAGAFRKFYAALLDYYTDCTFVCKPHPQDRGVAMPGLESPRVEIYRGGLTSQMHLDSLAGRVRACYAVISSSLIYAASRGIPAYVFYRYIGINLPDPKFVFESDEALSLPFLFNLDNLSQIGCIDRLCAEPPLSACGEEFLDWLQGPQGGCQHAG